MPESSEVIKSKSDSKEYRLIKLKNELRVLLISDVKENARGEKSMPMPSTGIVKADTVSDGGESSSDLDESDTTESEYGSECSEKISSDEEMGEDDQRKRNGNGHEIKKKQAAAALCINVGSFSDPEYIPGLAHFLEHMVFMGSKKYPNENKFDAFIRQHGGSDNASTDCEKTLFQFEVQPSHFAEALDIWAQFFIAPLMKQDSVDREVKAVDSEFDMALNEDDCRKEQLFGTLFPEKHPMAKFMWGNKLSLVENPTKRGIDVYGALKEFHKAYYSSPFMTLALQSPERLDTLEAWAREIFEDIPLTREKLPIFSPNVPHVTPFRIVKIKPVRNVQEIELVWILPPQQKFYKTKPLHYASWLIGHEGRGSLLSLLKRKDFALALSGGNSGTGFDQNSACSLFNVTITLTDKGFAEYCEVLDIVFQYLAMLHKEGVCERIFREIQRIEDIDFTFQEEETPIENVVKQSVNVLFYPEGDILTGDSLLFDYNPDCIADVLTRFTPEKCTVYLSSPTHKTLKNAMKEPWFGTAYATENMPVSWTARWSSDTFNTSIDESLHLPYPNNFVAEKYELKSEQKVDGNVPAHAKYPALISQPNAGHKVWFNQDRFFNLPKAYIHFHLVNPVAIRSPRDTVCLEILVHLLIYNLAEVAYDADAASMTYGAEVNDDGGLELKFSGYNDKLPLLVDTVADCLAGFKTTEKDFQQRLLEHTRSYYNNLIKPAKLAKSLRISILCKFGWSSIDKYEACRDLTYEKFTSFIKLFFSSLYIESLIQGNFIAEEANEVAERFALKMKCNRLTKNQIMNQRVIKLGCSHKICKVKAFNPADDNSMVSAYFQVGQNSTKRGALLRLLEAVMDEPCFDTLRTKQQLGYAVFVQTHNTSGILGMTVNVGTQNSKFSVEQTSESIWDFATKKMLEIINNMRSGHFEATLYSLVAVLRNEDTHLGEEVDRNWHEVVSRNYEFDRVQKEAGFLETCTIADLKEFFYEICLQNDKILHIQVRGNNGGVSKGPSANDGPKRKEEATLPPPLPLEFLCDGADGFALGNSAFLHISSLESLKISSGFYPVCDAVLE